MEVRCLDVDPFAPLGVDADVIRLLDVFLLHCLLADSPRDSPEEIAAVSRNHRLVAEAGRDPLTRLDRSGEAVVPFEWGARAARQFEPIAVALDDAHGGGRYGEVLERAQRALRDPSLLPSARVLHETEKAHGRSFPEFALSQSRRHRDDICARPLAERTIAHYEQLAVQSTMEQQRIEAADDVPFETFRQRYLGQDLLSGPNFR